MEQKPRRLLRLSLQAMLVVLLVVVTAGSFGTVAMLDCPCVPGYRMRQRRIEQQIQSYDNQQPVTPPTKAPDSELPKELWKNK